MLRNFKHLGIWLNSGTQKPFISPKKLSKLQSTNTAKSHGLIIVKWVLMASLRRSRKSITRALETHQWLSPVLWLTSLLTSVIEKLFLLPQGGASTIPWQTGWCNNKSEMKKLVWFYNKFGSYAIILNLCSNTKINLLILDVNCFPYITWLSLLPKKLSVW